MNEPAPMIRTATYQDVLDAPPNMVAELIEGALHLHPRPASRHARASFKIAARLDDPFENGIGGPGGWYLATEPELHLGADVVVPDVAGWRRACAHAGVSGRSGDRARAGLGMRAPLARHPPVRSHREAPPLRRPRCRPSLADRSRS